MSKPLVIAHRGASRTAPENTLAAFSKALEMGADGLELDIQLTYDGKIVVIHDETVDRTSDGSGPVKDKTLKELKALDFGGWFSPEYSKERIPELAEVMELLSGWYGLLNIELKNGPVFYPGIEEKTLSVVARYGMRDRVIISSFNHYSLVEVKKLEPGIRTGILYMSGLYEPWNYAKTIGANAIHPFFYNIVPEIIDGCRKNGIAVNPFTVDSPEHIRTIAGAGVDGIITNVPDVARSIIREMEG